MFTAIASNSICPSLILFPYLTAAAQARPTPQPRADKVATPLQTLANAAALQADIEKLDGDFLILREKVLQGVRRSAHLAKWMITDPGRDPRLQSWDPYPSIAFRSKGWAVCGAADEAVAAFNRTVFRYREVRDRLMKDPAEAICFGLVEIAERELVRPDEGYCPVCDEAGTRLVTENLEKGTRVLPDGTKVTQV